MRRLGQEVPAHFGVRYQIVNVATDEDGFGGRG